MDFLKILVQAVYLAIVKILVQAVLEESIQKKISVVCVIETLKLLKF